MTTEYLIKLDAKIRADGSVVMTSKDLPLFAVVLEKEGHIDRLLPVLDEYLRRNVPHYVDLRPVDLRPASELFSDTDPAADALPASTVAVRKSRNVESLAQEQRREHA